MNYCYGKFFFPLIFLDIVADAKFNDVETLMSIGETVGYDELR